MNAEQIINGILRDDPIAFIMPGGNVKGFVEALVIKALLKLKNIFLMEVCITVYVLELLTLVEAFTTIIKLLEKKYRSMKTQEIS